MKEEFGSLFMMVVAAIVIIFVATTVSRCTVDINNSDNEAIKKLVEKGVPALEAGCAVNGGNNYDCIITSAKSKDGE